MQKRLLRQFLSLCLAAALLAGVCALAADTEDGEEPETGTVLTVDGEPEDGAALPEGEAPPEEESEGDVPADGNEPVIAALDLEAEHEHDYVAGRCACGDVLPEYEWYYNSTGRYYYINTAGELAALADIVNNLGYTFANETVCLTADVNLTGIDWAPIGGAERIDLTLESQDELSAAVKQYFIVYDSQGNSYSGSGRDAAYSSSRVYYSVIHGTFSGTFDGGGYTISGLNVNTNLGYAGLFGYVNGTLMDFTVSGKVVYTGKNGDYVGGVTGMLAKGGRISGVTSAVSIGAPKAWNVGGIAGFVGTPLSGDSAGNTIVTMCVNEGYIIGCKKVGGIAGENAGMITLCVNRGTVNSTEGTSKNGTGGIAGRNGNNNTAIEAGTIRNCYNTGDVISGGKWHGGIVGFNSKKSLVENCYNTAKLSVGSLTNPVIGWQESTLGGNNYALKYDSYTSGYSEDETGILVTSDELKNLAGALGGAYVADSEGINDGYPVLAWQMGLVEAEGYPVTINNRTGTSAAASIIGVTNGVTYSGSVTFTVSGSLPCIAAYTTDGGETYTRLTAVANASGGYDFTVNVTGAMEIAVAVKGDANGDGNVNAIDMAMLRGRVMNRVTLSSLNWLAGDVNGDGSINAIDMAMVRGRVMNRAALSW